MAINYLNFSNTFQKNNQKYHFTLSNFPQILNYDLKHKKHSDSLKRNNLVFIFFI